MSVTVQHLNADSTFLLIFSPEAKPSSNDLLSTNGAFSVLIDPWLVGSSIVNAKWFAITNHVVPSSIKHLSEIEEPDVVLVSQNKPDHCHKQTLLQLRPEGRTFVAAEPGAAKAIKSWNHFDPNRVHALAKYDARARFGNTLRIPLKPLGPEGLSGELNIAFIPARNYVTGLHNAFGITYQPPTKHNALASVTTIDLPRRNFSVPFSRASLPASSPQMMLSPKPIRPARLSPSYLDIQADASPLRPNTAPQMQQPFRRQESQLPSSSNTKSSESLSITTPYKALGKTQAMSSAVPDINFEMNALIDTTDFANTLPTPPLSPSTSAALSSRPSDTPASNSSTILHSTSTSSSFSASLPYSPSLVELQSRYSQPPTVRPARPKAISVLYSPHGIPLSDLQPYIKTHLISLPGTLPLTCLLHSFNYASNPWYFGGNIMMGAEGGMAIARALMARCWISAHDEEKDDRGVAVKLLKCDMKDANMIKEEIARHENLWHCDVRSLDVGDRVCLRADPERKKYSPEGIGLGVEMGQFQHHDGA